MFLILREIQPTLDWISVKLRTPRLNTNINIYILEPEATILVGGAFTWLQRRPWTEVEEAGASSLY